MQDECRSEKVTPVLRDDKGADREDEPGEGHAQLRDRESPREKATGEHPDERRAEEHPGGAPVERRPMQMPGEARRNELTAMTSSDVTNADLSGK